MMITCQRRVTRLVTVPLTSVGDCQRGLTGPAKPVVGKDRKYIVTTISEVPVERETMNA